MQFYVFHLLINTETERNWNVGSSTLHVFRLFFSPGTSKRKFFFIWQVVCVLLRTRGMGQRSFLCDRHQNHRRVKSVSFSIIWHRHWERIGKILSSECKQVLKVQGEYQRLRLYAVFYSTIQDRCWMDLSTVY